MKKLKIIFIRIFAFMLLFSTNNLKAQDIKEGWYADGYNVESISCYSFQKLQVAFVYNKEWSTYDYLSISVDKFPLAGIGAKTIPLKSINNYLKNEFLVYSVFGSDLANIDLKEDRSTFHEIGTNDAGLYKGEMKYDLVLFGKGKPAADGWISATLYGLTYTGIKEEYDQGCQCVKKTPQYSNVKLSKVYKLVCTNRIKGAYKDATEGMDLTTPCTYEGTKVDFDNLGSSSSKSSSPSSEEKTTTVTKKITTKTTSAASSTSTSALNAKSLKPLDKTKPGDFAEKNDAGKVTREGYKKGNEVMIGEVRVYDDEGHLAHIYTYANGEKTGYEAEYDQETGNIIKAGNNKAGQKDGEWKRYKDGKAVGSDTYVDGEKQ
ncbi:MAG: toxin-antitoxin system YwqK family antitoxin [Bacteroidia bacterium]